MASFGDLPEDLVEYIFLHLSPYGELQTCREVCHDWHRLANGALDRLRTLFLRCNSFDWFLLQRAENEKFSTNIAERCSHAACYHSSGTMFVFGGCTAAYTTFNDLWRFNLTTRTWYRPIPMGSFPTPKACSTMVEYEGNLILFGGWSKSSPNPIHQMAMFYNELHVYDPRTNFWTQIANDGTAPCLAGHSSTVLGDRMVVFGGSHGTASSNQVWVFDIPSRQWFTPATSTPKPLARYGQSQILIDQTNILIIGGCGGPNLIFSDVWLLTVVEGDVWQWHEVTVLNSHLSAPQLWSHPACKVGNDKVVVLSKQPRSSMGIGGPQASERASGGGKGYRAMSASQRFSTGGHHHGGPPTVRPRGTWVPPQGNLIPPRRKLISSRSLDEEAPSPSPKSTEEKKTAELQRAHSIPAIIVGEIPKLVVTEDNSSGGNGGNGAGSSGEPGPSNARGGPDDDDEDGGGGYSRTNWPSPCIAVVASSLLPQHATTVEFPSSAAQDMASAAGPSTSSRSSLGGVSSNVAGRPPRGGPSAPQIKEKRNREKQLEILRRMEDYIRSKSQQHHHHTHDSNVAGNAYGAAGASTSGGAGGGGMQEKMKFRPSSPPPKPKQHRPSSFHPSKNPMCVYVMDLTRLLSERTIEWRVLDGNYDAPEDTILYSLVQGRGELILFGGMRSNPTEANQGLDVTPFSHTITNETYILRPPISF